MHARVKRPKDSGILRGSRPPRYQRICRVVICSLGCETIGGGGASVLAKKAIAEATLSINACGVFASTAIAENRDAARRPMLRVTSRPAPWTPPGRYITVWG